MAKAKEETTAPAAEVETSIENAAAEAATDARAAEADTSIENAADDAATDAPAPDADLSGQDTTEDGDQPGADIDDEAEAKAAENAARLLALEAALNKIGAATAAGTVPDDLRKALEEAEAVTTDPSGTVIVKLFGITAGSAFGLHRALLDWCMAASRVIMSGKAPE